LWHVEVANGLGMAERRKRLSDVEVKGAIALQEGLPLVIDATASVRLLGEVMDLMRAYRLTAYDAVYLELAMRLGLPLATNDQRLRRAAIMAGVAPFQGRAP
jgi:predicted nucleic acid-binding protein